MQHNDVLHALVTSPSDWCAMCAAWPKKQSTINESHQHLHFSVATHWIHQFLLQDLIISCAAVPQAHLSSTFNGNWP